MIYVRNLKSFTRQRAAHALKGPRVNSSNRGRTAPNPVSMLAVPGPELARALPWEHAIALGLKWRCRFHSWAAEPDTARIWRGHARAR
jgi:hypothetical protein